MVTHDLVHIAARAFNTPLLLHPRKAEVIASVLAPRLSGVLPIVDLSADHDVPTGQGHGIDRLDGEPRGPTLTNRFGESMVQERYRFMSGTAMISVEGSLVNRGAWVGQSMSGLTSYEGLAAQIGSAVADPDVAQIVLSLDSPGGEAAGAFEMAEAVRNAAAQKPVIAFVNGMAASAAYAIASAATRIVTIPSGVSGSIGVVMLHLDRSQQMAAAGIRPTLIFSGDHKVDGNPFAALPPDVAATCKAECDALRTMFVETVAKGRRGLSAAAVHATQARCYTGTEAVSAGLADEVGSLAGILGAGRPASSRISVRKAALPALADSRVEPMAVSPAAPDVAAVVLAERQRIAGILGHAEAEGRSTFASHLALSTSTPVEAAGALLKSAAKELPAVTAKAKTHRLDAIVPIPKVSAGFEGGDGLGSEGNDLVSSVKRLRAQGFG